MAFGSLIIRNGFLDVDAVPFGGTILWKKRRAHSAPATVPRSRKAPMMRPQVSSQVAIAQEAQDQQLEALKYMNTRLDATIKNTRRLIKRCNIFLNFVCNYREVNVSRRTSTFFASLQEAYRLQVEFIGFMMLDGILRMDVARVEHFFQDVQNRGAFNNFHIRFILDAQPRHRAKYFLIFDAALSPWVRCYTAYMRPRVIDASEARDICLSQPVICMTRDRQGRFSHLYAARFYEWLSRRFMQTPQTLVTYRI